MQTTTNYSFKMPDQTDNYNIQNQNDNWASLDSIMKSISNAVTAAQNTANAAIPSTQKGAASGVAPLDASSLIPSVNLPKATGSALGAVKVGSGIGLAGDGTISVTPYSLTPATGTALGGVKIGSGVNVDASGLISVSLASIGAQAALGFTPVNTAGGTMTGMLVIDRSDPGLVLKAEDTGHLGEQVKLTHYGGTFQVQDVGTDGNWVKTVFSVSRSNGLATTKNTTLDDGSGNIYVNASGPVMTSAGRTFFTLKGQTNASVIELAHGLSTDAAGDLMGIVQISDPMITVTGADKRVAGVFVSKIGTTANNKGGTLNFFAKADGNNTSGAGAVRLTVSGDGSVKTGNSTLDDGNGNMQTGGAWPVIIAGNGAPTNPNRAYGALANYGDGLAVQSKSNAGANSNSMFSVRTNDGIEYFGIKNGGAASFSGNVHISAGALGTAAGNGLELLNVAGTAGNNMQLSVGLSRQTAGTDWTGVSLDINKVVDATIQQRIRFMPNGAIQIQPYTGGGNASAGVELPSYGGITSFYAGTADSASYTGHNTKLHLHNGLGMETYDGTVQGYYDSRQGLWDVKTGYKINGVNVGANVIPIYESDAYIYTGVTTTYNPSVTSQNGFTVDLRKLRKYIDAALFAGKSVYFEVIMFTNTGTATAAICQFEPSGPGTFNVVTNSTITTTSTNTNGVRVRSGALSGFGNAEYFLTFNVTSGAQGNLHKAYLVIE